MPTQRNPFELTEAEAQFVRELQDQFDMSLIKDLEAARSLVVQPDVRVSPGRLIIIDELGGPWDTATVDTTVNPEAVFDPAMTMESLQEAVRGLTPSTFRREVMGYFPEPPIFTPGYPSGYRPPSGGGGPHHGGEVSLHHIPFLESTHWEVTKPRIKNRYERLLEGTLE